MKKYFLIYLVSLGFFILVTAVFAAGGGGGGSVPTCTDNVWTCTDWSSCSISGTQTRNCDLTFSCSSATNQKPIESQSCTPPPLPPEPPPPPSPMPSANQVAPLPTTPACAQSTFKCSNWSLACDANGQEHRSCNLAFDCKDSSTPPPATTRPCTHLQCGNKPTLYERISCRVNLNPAGVARELQIQYLPEACRAITDTEEKEECIERYKLYQSCWNLPVGQERFRCAGNILKLSVAPVADQIKDCKISANPTVCVDELRERVLYMISFRFYDLEQRAEDLFYRGVSNSDIADFDAKIEIKKQEFYLAKTDGQRRAIILDVRKAWRDFVNKVKDQVK